MFSYCSIVSLTVCDVCQDKKKKDKKKKKRHGCRNFAIKLWNVKGRAAVGADGKVFFPDPTYHEHFITLKIIFKYCRSLFVGKMYPPFSKSSEG